MPHPLCRPGRGSDKVDRATARDVIHKRVIISALTNPASRNSGSRIALSTDNQTLTKHGSGNLIVFFTYFSEIL